MRYILVILLCCFSFASFSPAFSQTASPEIKSPEVKKQPTENLKAVDLQNVSKKPILPQSISSYFPKTSQPVKSPKSLGIRDFITSFFFLSLIVAFIFAAAWLFKRTGLSPGTGNQLIKILSTVAVGQKEKISLIEIGNQQLLIGISPGNIQKLLILETPVESEASSASKSSTSDFASGLSSQLLKHFRANKNVK